MDFYQLISEGPADLMALLWRLLAEHSPWFYALAFGLTFFEGETAILLAGVWAALGLVDPFALIAVAWLGSFSGDQCWFWLGRQFGLRLLDRFPHWRHRVDTALAWLERYDAGFILSFRFVYGVRNISSFALGLSAVRWQRFLWLNFVAAGLWAASFVGVGYFLGHALDALLGEYALSFRLVMLGVFIVVIAAIVLLHRRQRRRQPRVPRGAALPPT